MQVLFSRSVCACEALCSVVLMVQIESKKYKHEKRKHKGKEGRFVPNGKTSDGGRRPGIALFGEVQEGAVCVACEASPSNNCDIQTYGTQVGVPPDEVTATRARRERARARTRTAAERKTEGQTVSARCLRARFCV